MQRNTTRTFALVLALLAGCATPAATSRPPGVLAALAPAGEFTVTEENFGQLKILGVTRARTASLNRRYTTELGVDTGFFREAIAVPVPLGTTVVVPCVSGWRLRYGELDPDTLAAHTDLSGWSWLNEDENYGTGEVAVEVIRINPIDNTTTPPTRTAVLRVILELHDENRAGDDWYGLVRYTLLFLGGQPQLPDPPDGPIIE